MSSSLDREQLTRLQDVLYTKFHNKEIVDVSTELQVIDNSDMMKIKMFVASKRISGRQDNTLAQYVREIMHLRNFLQKNFEDMTAMDLRFYFGTMKEQKDLSMVTMQGKMRYLNSFFTFLTKEGIIKENPIDKIESIKLEYVIKEAFSTHELESLKIATKSSRDRALIEFLYSTGVRVSELCQLNVGDLNMYTQEFKVMGKGRKERILYISDTTAFHLHRYFQDRLKKAKCTIEELQEQPLFTTMKGIGQRITIAGVQYALKRIAKRAAIANVHPHRFRRTFATDLLNRGMRIEEVMVLMGHTKIETTLIYCGIRQENVKHSYKRFAA